MKKVGISFGSLNFFLYISFVRLRDTQLNFKTMNIVRFNRHELFTSEMMDFHSTTLREMEDYYIGIDESWFNSLYNSLCGIWDGYLYPEMIESAKQMGLPIHIIDRIQTTIEFIENNKK